MQKKRILIIDDEKNIRMTVSNCLSEEDYEVDIAINGEEGFEMIVKKTYDLILLDIKMPGISGLDLLKKMRENHIDADVVMMTAYGTVERAVEAMKLGAIDFISKPFTPEEIRTITKAVTGRKNLKEESIKTFQDALEFAKACIVSKKYDKAEEYLKKAIGINVDSPEPHNLLGVLAEFYGKIDLAQVHYRAALALDPTYKPADRNLERTTRYNYSQSGVDLGNKEEDYD